MNINDLPTLDQIDLNQKRVFIREDLNVPLKDGVITDDTRIKAALPTIKKALAENAAIVLLSHLGRPTEGEFDQQYSLAPVAARLSELLNQPVTLATNGFDTIAVNPGEIVLAENVRFNKGETANDDVLAKKMASQCDVFVMDAFATAHRAHASTCGIAEFAKEKCAGPLLIQELTALSAAFENPKKPLVAIVGGSKVSTKFELLANLLEKVDGLIVGGGIANTFLKATGVDVGASLYEPVWVDKATELYRDAIARGVSIPLPEDVVVTSEMSSDATAKTIPVGDIEATDAIFDIGPNTASHYRDQLKNAKTIVWNGPVGVFEIEQFSHGTKALGDAIAASDAFSLAGGGDTLAALAKFNLSEKISYISTGGGAFLEFLEGKELPAVKILSEPRA